MINWNFDPVLFSLGSLEIRYYGLFYVIGFIMAFLYLNNARKKQKIELSKDQVYDLIFYLIIGVILGSRIFEVLFWNPGYYFSNPKEIIAVWDGGMSFHGGLIGVLTGGYIFCKQYKKDFYEMADIVVIPTVIGLGFGRIANFINGELYGRPTSLPWAVDFGDGIPRHPSQLYESAKNFIIFAILWVLKDKNLKKGTLFWTFITLYGAFRFTIEFVRQPDPQLGFVFFNVFTMGQMLTGIMAITGTLILVKWHLWPKRP